MDDKAEKIKNDYVFKQLRSGRENALSMSELAATCGLTQRQLREHMQRLRLHGAVIAGDGSGYYIPANDTELKAAYKQAFSRAKTSFKVLQPIKAALRCYGYSFYRGVPVKDKRQLTLEFLNDKGARKHGKEN